MEKKDLRTTQHDVPIVPPQNQDESVTREAPATSIKPMSLAANGEESKEKDNIEAPKFICRDNDNVPKIIRNNPKNDSSIIHHETQKPTIGKDVTT